MKPNVLIIFVNNQKVGKPPLLDQTFFKTKELSKWKDNHLLSNRKALKNLFFYVALTKIMT